MINIFLYSLVLLEEQIDQIDTENDSVDENEAQEIAHSYDRMIFSIIVWIEFLCLGGTILGFGMNESTPFDLDLPLFLLVVLCIFLIGHILEWKYHISYPFSEIHDNYTLKKTLLFGVIGLLSVVTLITILYFTFKFKFTKIFIVVISILLLSLIAIFIVTITEGIRNLFTCCKKKADENENPKTDQEIIYVERHCSTVLRSIASNNSLSL